MISEFSSVRSVHCVGLGGIGVSALARFFVHNGRTVSGSDRSFSDVVNALSSEGVSVRDTESAHNIDGTIDLLIHTPAASFDHPEIAEARRRGIPVLSYPEALGLLSEHMYTIAVAGTHGKTTTTAMIAHILERAGHDPTVIVGSLAGEWGVGGTRSNFRPGSSSVLVLEACEYKRSFLNLSPDILVITNIEEDHLDYFTDLSDIQDAFSELVFRVPEDGVVVYPDEMDTVRVALRRAKAQLKRFSSYDGNDGILSLNGAHNRMNARAAICATEQMEVPVKEAYRELTSFSGTWRRFEYKGETPLGASVYDDYAHHPRELAATLAATREAHPGSSVTVVFQPHLESRLSYFFDDFIKELSKADTVIVTPVYKARSEDAIKLSSSEDLVRSLEENGVCAVAVPHLDDVPVALKRVKEQDVVLVAGAGDIYTVTPNIVLENVSQQRYTGAMTA